MLITYLPEESRLLGKISEGDEYAFKIVYDKYRGEVYSRALYLLKSEILAEEVLQEVMLKLWQTAGKLREDTNLSGYLVVLTRNRSFQLLRRKVLEAKTGIQLGRTWTEGHNETEEGILLGDTRKLLAEGIDLLPPQQKMVYQLCHLEGLKYEEAARKMNLSPETVKSYMKLALRFLRTYLKTHTDVAAILVIFKLL